jgi:hypothetical protein
MGMTFVFDVFTDACHGTTLTGSVQYCDPGNDGFSQGPEFGLQLIMDAWYRRGESGAGPVSAATEKEFDEFFELYLGRKVYVDEKGYLLEDGSTNVRIPRVKAEEFYKDQLDPHGGRGMSEGVRYIKLAPRPTEFTRRTAEIIASFEITEDDSGEDDEDWGASAHFSLEVSDPRYLEHLTQSVSFRTAFTGHLPFA